MNDSQVIILTFCVLLIFGDCQKLPLSPCPEIYHYETDGIYWTGVILAPNPPSYGSDMTIKVRMSIRAMVPTEYLGKIVLGDDREVVLKKINKGEAIKYRVHFPMTEPLPSIVNINFDGKNICSGSPVAGRIVTAIDLEHTLHSGDGAKQKKNQNKFVNDAIEDESIIFEDDPETDLETRYGVFEDAGINFNPVTSKNGDLFINHGICGKAETTNPLIAAGQAANKGDWPWLVAVFMKKSRGLDFICAGSLISTKLVITAAHCVKKSPKKPPTKPEDLILKLGVHNLQDWTESTAVTKDVSKIKIHEEFNKGLILNNDIAVLKLKSAIRFTEFIRPVCLWSGDDGQERIVGEVGELLNV
jgi:hypothetical protein